VSARIRLAVFPVLGLALLVAAGVWSARELRLRFGGLAVEGRIAAMLVERENGVDLCTEIDAEVVADLDDGSRIRIEARNYEIRSATREGVAGGTSGALDAAALNRREPLPGLAPELARALFEAVRGDADTLRRAAMREDRRRGSGAGTRVVRIEKRETVRGHFGLGSVPDVLEWDGESVRLPMAAGSALDEVRVRAVFARPADSGEGGRKADWMTGYEAVREGMPWAPARRDFALSAEPYATQFRPVFAFEAAGHRVARLAHIGRHGAPTLALRLFSPCRVYFDPKHPAEAVVAADPGFPEGDRLAWFSRWCEGIFSQWGSTALLAIAGLGCLATGGLLISLAGYRLGEGGSP